LRKRWCIPEVGAEFVWRMEDVPDLYEEPYDPAAARSVLRRATLSAGGREAHALAREPRRALRYDYDYERRGTCNLFMVFEPRRGWRCVEVTERRTALEFAEQMRRLVDEHYPRAEVIRVVLDNLNTHTGAVLYQAFEPAEARRILRRLEFRYTPKHDSWLNQVEIELSVLHRQCLGRRRIPDAETLGREVGRWEQERNERGRQWSGASPRKTPGRSWHASTRHNHSGEVLE
jgi:transposase